ncbi:phosphoenolpyruvate carboxylase [Candidatus Roizmanbacteria bacterium RIFCSPLOWO2_01_FULL_37_12]|uniref:Phosphoenolpyruvate carboxylase n=1 Tax=Candidatus Roizmanbacteria bacterium RIFCSPLOWO2_01_FULL_37_12 TaxID=1802056 RepID=A0A1F7IFN3_9BACT|nr:MAG: phosphoenolpyruvate carboxylase [Candidatus Roizmanbacteria bacterium RIFCSPHIGHO2_02_FULL_37_9b]OGK42165.1 MAG: phosphoenolpyruvate carboxylase [Candidatus Roizmanbacteria bacterium RIFCSPLOWO2_01_FULL_37_12]
MRKIPSSMASQHPDNASVPFWSKNSFISNSDEIKESFICFSDLGIDEYIWDWEGKFVDEAVVDKLLHDYYNYFSRYPLGKEKFLTFRIPNPRVEKQFRLARAFMVAITNSQLMQNLGFEDYPIFEMILPLTESAEELINIQEAFRQLVNNNHPLLKMKDSIQQIELIPLVEQVDKIMNTGQMIKKYITLHKKVFGKKPSYLRPFLARSDPALNSGLVPTMLAIKVALSDISRIQENEEIKLYPILGTGSLPFRGGVTPDLISQTIKEYSGASTLVIQSGFRYDYPKSKVKQAIKLLKTKLQKTKAETLNNKEVTAIQKIIPLFEYSYKKTVEKLAPMINKLAPEFPNRRERMQQIGLFGYSRSVGSVKLPRAITFTGLLYSLGIPPEIIATGRGIRAAQKQRLWPEVSHMYKNLKNDLIRAGYFLNKANIEKLAKKIKVMEEIKDDINVLEETFSIELGPKNSLHLEHHDLANKVRERLMSKKKLSNLITRGGLIRKSLG